AECCVLSPADPSSRSTQHPARSTTVHAALFTVALLFSLNYIISKLGMREFSPLSFAWVRVAGAAAILALVMRDAERLSREDSRRVAWFAVLGVAVNATLFLVGLSMTTVQVAAVLITTIPVFTLAAAIAVGQERATAARIGGIALAGAGALLVVGGESLVGTWRSFAGAVMIVVNCLSYSLYLVVSKPHMARLSARAVVARMFLVGSLLLLPVAAYSLATEEWASISPNAWLALALVIAGPTVAAYLLQAWALRHAESSMVAAYTYVQPVLASVLGALVLGEQIRPIVVLAAAMIFGGVALAGRASGPIPE
ncbi:MAG TPA: DMT family transporter, partial [Thermoanaerobaculia bacterium]|nr:DMT family transporter [Thermoanaerobaculia bacterium]